MDVGVHDPGEDDGARADPQDLARDRVVDRLHRAHPAVGDQHGRRAYVVADEDALGDDGVEPHQQNPVTDAHASGTAGSPSRVRVASMRP